MSAPEMSNNLSQQRHLQVKVEAGSRSVSCAVMDVYNGQFGS